MAEPIYNTPSTRYNDYDTLNFIPTEDKNEEWAAEWIAYAKQNSSQFVSSEDVRKYRNLENGIINPDDYKKIIDPEGADDGGDEGAAPWFTADWKSNPIFNHLNKIVEANLEKIPINLYVKAADEFSQSNLQKENARILGREEMSEYVNRMNSKLGFPPLKKGSDPFRYVQSMQNPDGNDKDTTGNVPVNILDSVKANIEDDEDLALFNEYIWKDGVEIATEIGIKHYMQDVNRFDRVGEKLIKDLKNFKKAAAWWFTSLTTGKPVIQYKEPDNLYLSRYSKSDFSDGTHFYFEETITYGDFVREFGMDLDKDTLASIFEMNRENHGIKDNYEEVSFLRRNTARIKMGYIAFESQDMEVYSNYTIQGNNYFAVKPSDYKPGKGQAKSWNATREEQHYNVWYQCWYIPLAGSAINAAAVDFKKQAQYIFKFGKIQDQQREGDDERYAKNPLVLWSEPGLSFGEIMARYMGKINLLWFQFQNDLANVIPHGMIFYKEFMELALTSMDESSDGKDATTKFVRKLKQTGSQIGKLFNTDGNPNAQQFRPYDEVKTGHLASAIEKLNAMSQLYEIMKASLGISDTAEGQDPKPRQSAAGIKLALQASNQSNYYIEKGYTNIVTEIGSRLMYYINDIVNEKDSKRLQDFIDVVGKANGMAAQSIRSIPMHKLGLGISNVITDDQKARLQNMVDQMAGAGQIDMGIAMFLQTIDNLKYAYAITRLYLKKRQKQIMAETQAANEQAMKIKNMDLQISQAQIQAQLQGRLQEIELDKKLDGWLLQVETVLKTKGQQDVKNTIKDNRIEENIANAEIQRQLDARIPDQEVVIPDIEA